MANNTVDGPRAALKYQDSDWDALRGHEQESSSSALNRIGQHAGLTRSYTVRGDDKTEREIKAEHKDKQMHEGLEELGVEGGEEAGVHVAEHAVEHFAAHGADVGVRTAGGVLLLPLTLVKAGYNMAKSVAEDGEVGHERANALVKDAMHAVALANLNGLPQGYVDEQMARYPESVKRGSFATRMDDRLANAEDRHAMARLQLHSDQGMSAARRACDAGIGKDAFLKTNPDLAKRCDEDLAFKAGFDAMFWAKAKGPETYSATTTDLEARDARYEQHHVAWRA